MAINFNGYTITSTSMIFNGILMNPNSTSNTFKFNVEDFVNNRVTLSFFGTHKVTLLFNPDGSVAKPGYAGCSFTIFPSEYFYIDKDSIAVDTNDFYDGMYCTPDDDSGITLSPAGTLSSNYSIYNGNKLYNFAFSPKVTFTLILKDEYINSSNLYDWVGKEICSVSHGGGGNIIFSLPEDADFGEEGKLPRPDTSISSKDFDIFNTYDFGDVIINQEKIAKVTFQLNNVYRRGITQPLIDIKPVISNDIYETTYHREYILRGSEDRDGLAYCTYSTTAYFTFKPDDVGRHFANFNCYGMFFGNNTNFDKMVMNVSFYGRGVLPSSKTRKYDDSGDVEKDKRNPYVEDKPTIIRRKNK